VIAHRLKPGMFSELAAPTSLKLMSSKAFPGDSVAQIYRAA
jgi:hypothetical protein